MHLPRIVGAFEHGGQSSRVPHRCGTGERALLGRPEPGGVSVGLARTGARHAGDVAGLLAQVARCGEVVAHPHGPGVGEGGAARHGQGDHGEPQLRGDRLSLVHLLGEQEQAMGEH